MQKSIGILYICTGAYKVFWKEFYQTFEENFLPHTSKRYFIFSDSEELYCSKEQNIKIFKIEHQPWPLITLLRFHTFLKAEDDLKNCDYLMFANANIVCNEIITEEEFLPRDEKGEKLFVVNHPGYYDKGKISFPYDRNPKSLAYIPWNCGEHYVLGGMFGGTSADFLELSKLLKHNIEEDLKKNIIATWHDESHLNRYIMQRDDVRILPPEYCFPTGFLSLSATYAKRISLVDKYSKFDIETFKGYYEAQTGQFKKLIGRILHKSQLKERIFLLRDVILHKEAKRI